MQKSANLHARQKIPLALRIRLMKNGAGGVTYAAR